MPTRALIPLPADPTPTGSTCVQFLIPNDSQWKGMFWGALYQLSAWNSYDRDNDHTGAVVADRWKDIIAAARTSDCEVPVDIQFRQTNCLLEYSLDAGLTWATAYSGTDCLTWAIDQGIILGGSAIDDAILAGKLSGGNQNSPTPGTPGSCQDFFVTLKGSDRWHCPIPVAENDTITTQAVYGGWYDGNVLHPWRCPDGNTFALGVCGGFPTTEGTDPAPSIDHMRLVGNFDTTWMDMYNQTYTIPTGTAATEFYLQANDSQLYDNQGAITFKVTVCTGWCLEFDFTVSDHGFVIPAGEPGEYVAGVGFQNDLAAANKDGVDFSLPAGVTTHVAQAFITIVQSTGGAGGGPLWVDPFHQVSWLGAGTHVYAITVNGDTNTLWIGANGMDGSSGHVQVITHLKVVGTGALPTVTAPCV